jgi:iron(III) transport system permease protein
LPIPIPCYPSGWTLLVICIAAVIAAPVIFVLGHLLVGSGALWSHLAATVLPRYVANSCWLLLGVGSGVAIVGVTTAWLVTLCRFPGYRIFEWALLLPLAAPAYVLAYVYTDWLEFAGPVQTTLRQAFGWKAQDYWFPDIRSLGGAITLLTLVLYPYVYLLVRVAFLEQSARTLEVSRVLGCNPWRSFHTVALPLARPAIAAGTALALMETLNDFGTVQYFGVDTFTTGIYRTWFGMGDRVTAAQLAAVLMLFILGVMLLEQGLRGRSRYYQTGACPPTSRYHLTGLRGTIAVVLCFLPILLGFLLPIALLLKLLVDRLNHGFNSQFWKFAAHSLTLGATAAGLAVLLSVIIAYGVRLRPSPAMQTAARVAALGYAIPGSVIAVGVLIPVGWLDNTIDAWARSNLGISTGLLLSGTIAALVFAYLVRFLALSFNTVEAGLGKIKPSLDEAARSLGQTAAGTLITIHTPLLWSSLVSAVLLVFVDVVKELPATLVMRPFNFDTLAVQVYRLASDERLAEAAGAAIVLVAVGMIPVILLSVRIARSQR